MTPPESEEELKSLLMKVKVESEKVGLELNIQKTKIMASSPITSWEIDGETVSDFIFLGSKISTDGDCSHEIKRCLLLGRKVMTNLDSIFKSRDITLPTEVRLGFFLWSCMDVRIGLWRRLSTKELMLLNCGVGEDSWESLGLQGDQTSQNEINPKYSLEGLMLKLKLQYLGHLMQRADSLGKTLMLGKIESGEGDDRGWDGWVASSAQWTWIWTNSRRWWRTGKPGVLQSMGLQRVGHDLATEQ